MQMTQWNEDIIKNQLKMTFLDAHKEDVYEHTLEVVAEAKALAEKFSMPLESCIMGAYLHDVGRTLKRDEYIEICELEGIEILEEEYQFPRILHGKVSAHIAKTIFDVTDETLLCAIKYHSSLRANPSTLEKIVFLADKLSWKDKQYESLVINMREALDISLDEAIWIYLKDLHLRSKTLKLYHPLAKEAYEFFAKVFLDK